MADARCYLNSIGWTSKLSPMYLSFIKGSDKPKCIFTDRGGARNCGSGPYFKWIGTPYVKGFKPRGVSQETWTSGRYTYTGYSENFNDYYFGVIEYRYFGNFQRYDIIGARVLEDHGRPILVQPDFSSLKWEYRDSIIDDVRDFLMQSFDGLEQQWSNGELIIPKMECRFQEYNTFLGLTEFQIYTGGSASRFQAAYMDAYENLPKAATNAMANVIETIGVLKDIITKGPLKAIFEGIAAMKDPRDAWLSYRYVYTTTKLDMHEYKEFFTRVQQLKDFTSGSVSCAGHYSDETGSYRCEMVLPLSRVIPTNLSDWLSKCGFNLTATNVWDLIPYSFVVDWFIGVSDFTEYLENWSGVLELSPDQIWLTYMNEYDEQFYFYRAPGSVLSVPPAYHDKVVSQRTFTMRCADTVSLFSKH